MNEFMENKIGEEELNEVTGGVGAAEVKVRPITPIWVRVTSSSLNCRYTPNGEIAKIYEKGHKLKVDGITADGEWYRLLIYDPRAAPATLTSTRNILRRSDNNNKRDRQKSRSRFFDA